MMWVNVGRLAELANPLLFPPWVGISKIAIKDIEEALEKNNINFSVYDPTTPWSYNQHVERIAYWMKCLKQDTSNPITIDFGSSWIIFDGNHRLAAAILIQQDMIWADVYGSKDKIRKLYEEAQNAKESQCACVADDLGQKSKQVQGP